MLGMLTAAVETRALAGAGVGDAIDAATTSEWDATPLGLDWLGGLGFCSTPSPTGPWASAKPLTDALDGGVPWGDAECCAPLGVPPGTTRMPPPDEMRRCARELARVGTDIGVPFTLLAETGVLVMEGMGGADGVRWAAGIGARRRGM